MTFSLIIIIIILYYFLYFKNTFVIGGNNFKSALVFFGYKEDEKSCSDLINIIKSKIPTIYTQDHKADVIICHSIGIIDAIIAQKKYKCPIIAIDTTPNLKSSIDEMKPPIDIISKIVTSPDLTEISGDFILLRRHNPKVAQIIAKSDNYMIEKYPTKFKIINLPQEVTHYIWRTQIGKTELMKLL